MGRVRVDLNGMMRTVVGERGITDEDLGALAARLDMRGAAVERTRRSGLAAVPHAKTELRRTLRLAESVRGAFDHLVVLASDALRLGVHAALGALEPADADAKAATDALQVHVLEDLDPAHAADLRARLDLRRTLFNVMSGAGDALETIAPFLVVRERLLRELGAVAYKDHVVVTTRADGGPLRQIVNDEGFRDLTLPDDVSDAHALLTPAALFPSACRGADVAELLAGAAVMEERCREGDVSPARRLAAALLTTHGGGDLRVHRPSVHTLAALGRWIEHVGAPETGAPAEPDAASADAMPRARRVTLLLRVERRPLELELPKAYQDLDGVGYLGGQGLGTLADRREEAAELAHWNGGMPTLTLRCPDVLPHALGQLVHLVAAASTLVRGVTVASPIDEAAIRFAYGLANRPGYEAERAEAQRWTARREDRHVL